MLAESMCEFFASGDAPDRNSCRCIRSCTCRDFIQLSYFTGPWLVRITFILFSIWWGFGEIVRLTSLRHKGRILYSLSPGWQGDFCKGYVLLNLGLAEPCLFLALVFLLRAPLQNMESGRLNPNWNRKTIGYILCYCLPVFVLQLIVVLVGPQLNKVKNANRHKIPHYFTSTVANSNGVDLCTYPLFSTILLGLFGFLLAAYLLWLGRRIVKLVINKGLQKRVYVLILSVSGFLPLRILLLGLSVLSKPDHMLFEGLVFSAFLSLLWCTGICMFFLVYRPVADSLALGAFRDFEARRRLSEDQNETASLIANQSQLEESNHISPGRNSNSSTTRGSISFRTYEKDGPYAAAFVELSLYSPSQDLTSPDSSLPLSWPMRAPQQM
ncbi:hypothetical protein MLD38_000044 [Melastoma candidum]|uniref:Uncharacterized protein n=1 Tax=Melastoma candidum TaxID=119954 RepID=A0ACB9SAD7_9MYRT|nr:hypothetical protein MLD38_000044 [Melastoma candidum]